MSKQDLALGVIGGSGLYAMDELKDIKEIQIKTPFGKPSGPYVQGTYHDVRLTFLSRHGKGHHLLPSEINYRANIYGFKTLGVERIVATGACGSLKENLHPGEILIPDQYIDRTNQGRACTFFGEGIVAHIMFGDPVCNQLRSMVLEAAKNLPTTVHPSGTYINMEGPAFSTRAESNMYRQWGADVIGMTNLLEAKLAREAEICYATVALITDYDCWKNDEEDVSVDMIIAIIQKNTAHFKSIIAALADTPAEARTCGCHDALKAAILTDRSVIPKETIEKLKPIIGKYV